MLHADRQILYPIRRLSGSNLLGTCARDKICPKLRGVSGAVYCGINILKETGNPDNLKEELGDLLLQVMFHAVIAEEEGLFTLEDIAKTVSDKMERRHPHVFAGKTFSSEEERKKSWEKIKAEEKAGKESVEEFLPAAFAESKELISRAEKRKGFFS